MFHTRTLFAAAGSSSAAACSEANMGPRKCKKLPIVVCTDAMYDASASPPACIGISIHDPEEVILFVDNTQAVSIFSDFSPRPSRSELERVLLAVDEECFRRARARLA